VPSGLGPSKKGPDYRFLATREAIDNCLPGMEEEPQLPFPTLEMNQHALGSPASRLVRTVITPLPTLPRARSTNHKGGVSSENSQNGNPENQQLAQHPADSISRTNFGWESCKVVVPKSNGNLGGGFRVRIMQGQDHALTLRIWRFILT
jgi:hypothetical protein